ncbi:MAG: right-handed parallel beta-helix repeat-containing protein [Thermoplasmatales archaeon]|nr:MAG: right-handed parallel beta-helix repeat-containing protein [Thermoplasmatales archaeon]
MRKYLKRYRNRHLFFKKIYFMPIIFMILFSFSILINQIGSCLSNEESILYVSSSGDENFSTIQDGIDTAHSGDTIFVYNGTYFENIVIDKKISLLGENINTTIIDGRGSGNVIKINVDHVTIQGFTIRHSGLIFPNAGINCSSNYNIITENLIINNFYGITLYHSLNNIITENTIQNNNHCGIYMSRSSYNTIIGNTIQYHPYNGIGIYDYSDNNTIQCNSLTNNDYCGCNIRTSSNNTIINNTIRDNNIGIRNPSTENIISGNVFSNNNKNVEQKPLTPGFEIVLVISCILLVVFLKQKQ